jgi:hypothetical protein
MAIERPGRPTSRFPWADEVSEGRSREQERPVAVRAVLRHPPAAPSGRSAGIRCGEGNPRERHVPAP